MRMKSLLIIPAVLVSLSLTQCKKAEGPGGKAAIHGTVVGINPSNGQEEEINITVTSGATVEHGQYFIINGLAGNPLYYVWFNNPVWSTNGNPFLAGRTGIQVNFNYSDSNITLATAIQTALAGAIGNEYSVTRQGDLITLKSVAAGEIIDADNGSTSFSVDVAKQGKNADAGTVHPLIDRTVYLIYGDGSTYYNESVQTGAAGSFAFNNLRVGKYTVYTLSKDATTGEFSVVLEKKIEITDKESINDAGTFSIDY